MVWPVLSMIVGLALLVWSADRFVDGAAALAKHFAVPPLLIGMVVIGFGTSAPELLVSALAATQGNPGIALGNAYGSNITNIALILGIVAVMRPILVQSAVVRQELPILLLITALAAGQLYDGQLSRGDALILLAVFVALMAWSIYQGMRNKRDALAIEAAEALSIPAMPLQRAALALIIGLLIMMVSSRLLVWGAVEIAHHFGVSDLIIGLTIIALGTSLPELASAIVAARKGEHDLVLGNVLGSNLFNTLAVVGLAGVIAPMAVDPMVLRRDVVVMAVITAILWLMGFARHKGEGRINRYEGLLLLSLFFAYSGYLLWMVIVGGHG